jgi:electron transfer flavoprotein beta subunit
MKEDLMKAFVLIKQVPDTETVIRLKADKSGVELGEVKWIMNPYDEFALEDAIRNYEAGKFKEVVAVSVGPLRVQDTLRNALAVGAHRAIHVECDPLDSFATGKLLAAAIKQDGLEGAIIYAGKLAIDDDCAQVPQYVAEDLNIPHISVVLKYTLESGEIALDREIDGGSLQHYQLKGPVLIGAQKSMNGVEMRYAKVPDILKAKKKEIKKVTPEELGVEIKPSVRFFDFELPRERGPVKMITGEPAAQAAELARLLREEAKII